MRFTLIRALAALVALVAPAVSSADPLVPSYTDETASAGISSVYNGEWEFMVGGGAATFDCDDDSYPDLLLAGGTDPAHFYRNASTRGGPLKFTEDAASGLELKNVSGAYPIDINGDRITDIVLLRVGENVVMRGLGGCRFERANEAWGFDGGDAWSTALSATWEKGNRWPTIAIGNYIDRTKGAMPWGSCTPNWIHRPNADGTGFAPPIALKPSFCALSILFTDWNRSGIPSLRVSNDREYYKGGTEQMWHVVPGEKPKLYTEAEGWKTLKIWGMGIASRDITGDGLPDYYLTSMADNKLQVATVPADGSPAKATFADVAWPRGVTAQRPYTGGDVRPSTAWHAQFEDVNNDGYDDLFVAKGNVAEMPDFAADDPNNLLIQKPDGTFQEVGDKAGVASMKIARGAALTDFNLDGLVDLVVVNRWKPAEIWRNTTVGAGHWLGLRLTDEGGNRDGIGAWIEVKLGDRVTRREIWIGAGHAGGQLGWWHFGLGDITKPDVRVIWPDGKASDWQSVDADGFYVIDAKAGISSVAVK